MNILLLILIFSAGILIVLCMGSYLTQRFVHTLPFKDHYGNCLKGSIHEFKRVRINGDRHAVLIRGRNVNNPVLLFLHAGPCLSETALMRKFHTKLEDFFTMVYYDMRGSAKSFSPFQNYKKTFKTDTLLQDIHEMTLYLKNRLNKKKIGLMGHSFGAGFGAMAAARYPDDYLLFIGIGQPANPTEINRISYSWVLATAKNNHNHKAINELVKVDQYWELDNPKEFFPRMMVHKKWIGYYGGQLAGKTGFVSFVLRNLLYKEYNVFDYLPYLAGMMAGGPASFDIMKHTDLNIQASTFNQPVIFITGRQDYNVVPELVEKYYSQIEAPVKKMYWLENSAHFPHMEEPELFHNIMMEVRQIAQLYERNNLR